MIYLKDLEFDKDPTRLKYQMIVDSFLFNISNGNIKKNEVLPSINEFSRKYRVSRDTVERAYRILKDKNVIATNRGKNTYIKNTALNIKSKVLFLINKFSAYKLKVYHSFIESIGDEFEIQIEIYHCNESLFVDILNKHLYSHDYFVIMPHFKVESFKSPSFTRQSLTLIKQIPRDKLVILDNNDLFLNGDYIEIYQDFENDIFCALEKVKDQIINYRRIILRIPDNEHYPYYLKIMNGFKRFCAMFSMDYEVSHSKPEKQNIQEGDLFIIMTDDDLVNIIDLMSFVNMEIGKQVGLICYNESPLKRLLGISVISTDFEKMGRTASKMIKGNLKGKVKNPFKVLVRKSLQI